MPGIGIDIKEVLEELGSTAIIYKYDGTIINEKMDFENYPTNSSEFIRQFFATLSAPYDSQIASGDTIFINNTYFLSVLVSTSAFENEAVDITVPIYRCNVYGSLKRLTEERNANYVKVPVWVDVKSPLRALQYEEKSGNSLEMEGSVMGFVKEQHSLFIPIGVPVAIDDRWYPDYMDTTKYYRITSMDKRRLDNISICVLEEDSR